MASTLALAMDMIDTFDGQETADATTRLFFSAFQPLGLRALYARAYPVRAPVIATEILAAQEHVYGRVSPPGWEDAYTHLKLNRDNPTIFGFLTRYRGFSWSEIGQLSPSRRWPGWSCIGDFNIEGGFGIPCHGPHGYCAGVSLGFESMSFSPRELQMIELASIAFHDRMMTLSPLQALGATKTLSPREADCIGFVAEGKSDWEISVILGLSQATAHAHVENAKRKLGAKTRPQAVARAARAGLI